MSLNLPKVSGKLDGISPLILGGATFNTQYNDNPYDLKITELLLESFKTGLINAIDTSPYYGPSEELYGNSLNQLINIDKLINRDNFYICTKVGRIQLDEFDYSPKWIQKSIDRSLKRLHTDYLDIVYLHDIEFVNELEIIEAIRELNNLKKLGKIKKIGISGYPVEFLYYIVKKITKINDIGNLDTILSYSNGCLQNIRLLNFYNDFVSDDFDNKGCGLETVNNGSILSMSLLRSQATLNFHPCSQDLKDKVTELSILLKNDYSIELAELSTRYAIRLWKDKKGSIVLGLSNLNELKIAIDCYKSAINDKLLEINDNKLIKISQDFLGSHFNEVWSSGIEHDYKL